MRLNIDSPRDKGGFRPLTESAPLFRLLEIANSTTVAGFLQNGQSAIRETSQSWRVASGISALKERSTVMKNPIRQKQAITPISDSLQRSPWRRSILLIPFVLAWFAHSPNAAAQRNAPVVTKTPTIKLKFADLWCPSGVECKFYFIPNYNTTTGVLTVAVGNAGGASSPSCALRVKEYRAEDETSGPWIFHKDYWATVPALIPGQQVAIAVQVLKWSGGFNSNGKPIKHPRRWIIKADANDQVFELDENNNGTICYTYNQEPDFCLSLRRGYHWVMAEQTFELISSRQGDDGGIPMSARATSTRYSPRTRAVRSQRLSYR